MAEKSLRKKIKDFIVGTFALGSIVGGGQLQAQENNNKEEFQKEQQESRKKFDEYSKRQRAEWEAYKKQQSADWETYKQENAMLLQYMKIVRQKAGNQQDDNKIASDIEQNRISENSLKNKTKKIEISSVPQVKKDIDLRWLNKSPKADTKKPLTNLKAYGQMIGLLPQMFLFIDNIDKKMQDVVPSNRSMYYQQAAYHYAEIFGRMSDQEGEKFFAKEFNGAEIVKVNGLRFVSYKGLGYEIKPNGGARWHSDCRDPGPHLKIDGVISKAVQREQSLMQASQKRGGR